MPFSADRVWQVTTDTGTGALALSAGPTTHRSFGLAFNDNTPIEYCITLDSANQWEVGIGHTTGAGAVFVRDRVIAGSSGAGVLVNFSAGTKQVFATLSGETHRRAGYGRQLAVEKGWVNW